MKEQFINKVTQSLFMWIEHQICKVGEGYINVNTQFYDTSDRVSGYYSYSCPYDQFIADTSVTGSVNPNIMTGIYLSGNYVNVGQSGFVAADFFNGTLLFDHEISNPSTNLTGNFAIKEVNFLLTDDSEQELLFDKAYKPKMSINKDYDGMKENETNIPVIFLKYIGGTNTGFAFGGLDECLYKFRAMIFADNLFQLEAITSILRDKQLSQIPIMSSADNPFNFLGYYKGASYDYSTLSASKSNNADQLTLNKVFVNTFSGFTVKQMKDMPRGVQMGAVDLEVLAYRHPRS